MTTLDYYNDNAKLFINSTVDVRFTDVQDKFLNYIEAGGRILDFGCGSGRDTKYFLSKGYVVDAFDGSKELCKLASEYTGINVENILFQDFKASEKYDGIWACASILHLPKTELKDVLSNIKESLKSGGYFYTSFKYGDFEGERHGRYFTDFTEESFAEYIKDIELSAIDMWITSDARPDRQDERWLNVIMRK